MTDIVDRRQEELKQEKSTESTGEDMKLSDIESENKQAGYSPGDRIEGVEEEGFAEGRVSLPALVDKSFIINSVDYAPSLYDTSREYAILECEGSDGSFVTTTSAKPVMRQIKKLRDHLPVRVTVERIPLKTGATYRLKDVYKS